VIVAFWAENTCQSDNSKEEEKVYRIDLRTSLQIYNLEAYGRIKILPYYKYDKCLLQKEAFLNSCRIGEQA